MSDHRAGVGSKQVHILCPCQFAELHIGAVHGAQCQRAVEHELHIASSGRLPRSQGNLLGNLRRRNQLLCIGHIIVGDHDKAKIRIDVRIPVDQILQKEQ